jgi:hypothetical protein
MELMQVFGEAEILLLRATLFALTIIGLWTVIKAAWKSM